MTRDHQDALIDQLLREVLGGDRPRDMTARVLAQARVIDRARRTWWIGAASALAASVVLAMSLWTLWPRQYPAPRLNEGSLAISTPTLERGSRLETDDDESANVQLGGYVNVSMSPETSLTLGGTRYEEKVILERGHLDVNVTKNKGKFDIAVGPATVHVTGTSFGIGVVEELDDAQILRKRLKVSVNEGSVVVQGVNAPKTLAAGTSDTFEIEPLPKITPPILVQTPPVKSPGAGLMAGAREGNRIGTRGNQPLRPFVESLAAPARPGAGRGPNGEPALRELKVVLGTLQVAGYLRHERDVYFLESPRGNVFLYTQQPPLSTWKPVLDRPIRVRWDNGKIISVESIDAARGGTL